MSATMETEKELILQERKRVAEFVLAYRRLPQKKRERADELLNLLNGSEQQEEQLEIAMAIAEIVLPTLIGITRPVGTTADPDDGIGPETRRKASAYRNNIGEAIRKRREELKLTQAELAARAGLPQSHISRLEIGQHAPTKITIERLAKALETEPSQLDLLYN